jgi:hypothetical protein
VFVQQLLGLVQIAEIEGIPDGDQAVGMGGATGSASRTSASSDGSSRMMAWRWLR